MNALLAFAVLVAAGAGGASDLSLSPSDAAVLRAVEDALRANPELLDHHCGYRALLDANPPMASAEDAFVSLAVITSFREREAAFDEALANEPSAEALLNRYAEALSRDTALLRAVDAVFRDVIAVVENAATAESIRYMLGHVDTAIEWLGSPSSNRQAPDGLGPLAAALRLDPDRRRALSDHLFTLHENPLAHTHVFPWWQVADGDDAVGQRYALLLNDLLRHGTRFWTWHRREVALAMQPHARDWIRYWHRRLRRAPELADRYYRYRKTLLDNPMLDRGVCQCLHGDSAPDDVATRVWPPESKPPALEPLAASGEAISRPQAADLMPKRPDRPSVPRPAMPAMPIRPATPEKPERPSTPEPGVSRVDAVGTP